MPRPECGSVWPPACSLRPGRGRFTVAASWQLPGTASYSAYMPMVGPGAVRPVRAEGGGHAAGAFLDGKALALAAARHTRPPTDIRARPSRRNRRWCRVQADSDRLDAVETGKRGCLRRGRHRFLHATKESSEAARQKVICFPGSCKFGSPEGLLRIPSTQALRALDSFARHGSVWRAADELHLTRSAVSHQLRLLERDLGFDLLERIGKGVALTPRGQRYASDVRKALTVLGDAVDAPCRHRRRRLLQRQLHAGLRLAVPVHPYRRVPGRCIPMSRCAS